MTVVACDKQEEPESKPVHVKNEKRSIKNRKNLKRKKYKFNGQTVATFCHSWRYRNSYEVDQDGANINVEGDNGETPVLAATYQNHVETVKALVVQVLILKLKMRNKVIHFFMQVERLYGYCKSIN